MDAIRNSEDRYRTLESFWKGQVRSKVWLVESLEKYVTEPSSIVIHGGWNGVLASLLFNSNIPINKIYSYDIDENCEEVASTVNKRQEIEGRFRAITGDITMQLYRADIVINTICEHLTQDEYDRWLKLTPEDALVVLQSNNFTMCEEHVRCANSLEDFIEQSGIEVIHAEEVEHFKYTRYMIIGKRFV